MPGADVNSARIWRVSRLSATGATVTLDVVRAFIVQELRKTDIEVSSAAHDHLSIGRNASFWRNRVGFSGTIRFFDNDQEIAVQLLGSTDPTAAAAGGIIDICFGILVCPPALLCAGVNGISEFNYVERSMDAMLSKMRATLGVTISG